MKPSARNCRAFLTPFFVICLCAILLCTLWPPNRAELSQGRPPQIKDADTLFDVFFSFATKKPSLSQKTQCLESSARRDAKSSTRTC